MGVLDSAVLLLRAANYSGTGDWLDESGNGHDGTISGPTFANGSFTFDGIDDVITVADHADLNIGVGDSFTVMVAFRPAVGFASGDVLVDKRSGSTQGWQLYLRPSEATFVIADGGAIDDRKVGLVADTFHVAAGVRNVVDDDIEGFLDGAGSGTPTTDSTTGTLSTGVAVTIGRRAYGAANFFPGEISGVAMWRVPLSDADVVAAGAELQADSSSLTLLGVG